MRASLVQFNDPVRDRRRASGCGPIVDERANFEEQARTRLIRLDSATSLEDLRALRANRLEGQSGNSKGQFSIRINDQY